MAVDTELSLRLPNTPGALADVCRVLAAERVTIVALSLDPAGHLRFVVDNPGRTEGALRARRHTIAVREVLTVRTSLEPGELGAILRLLASAGVNVDYVYGGPRSDGERATVVLGVDDPMRAAAAAGL